MVEPTVRSEIGSSVSRAGSEPALSMLTRYPCSLEVNPPACFEPVIWPEPVILDWSVGALIMRSSRTMPSCLPMLLPLSSLKYCEPWESKLKETRRSPDWLSVAGWADDSAHGARPGPLTIDLSGVV